MNKLLKGGGITLYCRAYNDIDHITPIAYKLKKDHPNVPVELVIIDLKRDYQADFRIKYLKGLGVEVIHILTLLTEGRQLLSPYFKIHKRLDSLSKYNVWRIVISKLIMNRIVRHYDSILKNLSGAEFIRKYFLSPPNVMVFDQSYLHFYYNLCQFADANGIATVAVPHGHNILDNELIMNSSMKIHYGKSDELLSEPKTALRSGKKFKMPYKYVVYENKIISQRYSKFGIINSNQAVVIGSSRFSDEWVAKLRDIMPAIQLPPVSDDTLKIVIMLSKPTQNGHPEELERTLRYISLFPNTFVIIKPHTRGKKYTLGQAENILIDNTNEYPSPNLIDWADIVFFEHSCISFDSLKRDKPTVYLKNTHANRLMSEKYFNSWEVHCRDDIRDILWKALKDKKSRTYSTENVSKYIKDVIEPIDKDVLGLYSNFFMRLLTANN